MKNLLTHRRSLVVPALLGFCACAFAESLGNPVADAWIGQPLEVTIPARLASDAGDSCVQAQVAYGDTQVPPGQVHTTVLGTGPQRQVRVQVARPIDEPAVTVTVRAGCKDPFTRSYSLLPEMPSEAVLAAATGARPVAVATPIATPIASSARVPALTAAPLRSLRASTALGPHPRRGDGARAARHESLGSVPRLAPAPAGELLPALHTTTTLSPLGDAARSATARLLWEAINADPQQLMRSTANLQRLERELAQLRSTDGQTRIQIAELRRSLDRAQPWYASAYTAQVLSLLVLAAAAATAVLAWRARTATREALWFEPQLAAAPDALWDPAFQGAEVEELASPAAAQKTAPQPQPVPAAARASRAEPVVAARADSGITPTREPAREQPPLEFELPATAAQVPVRRASGSVLRVETLAATFEEVEFLVSLGLQDDATDVLKAYVEDSAGPAPLAYFELMRLCAQDGAPTVDAVRRRYAQVFGVEAPRLEQVTAPLGLENDKVLSERISRAWGTGEALLLIEQALFEACPPAAALTVQAGRDLLSLHDLAMGLVGESLPESESHPLAPWAAAEDALQADAAAKAAADALGGHHFALDVDLGASHEPLPEPVLQPDPEEIAARLKAEKEAARQAFARKIAEEEDAFSAAVAAERVPVSRY